MLRKYPKLAVIFLFLAVFIPVFVSFVVSAATPGPYTGCCGCTTSNFRGAGGPCGHCNNEGCSYNPWVVPLDGAAIIDTQYCRVNWGDSLCDDCNDVQIYIDCRGDQTVVSGGGEAAYDNWVYVDCSNGCAKDIGNHGIGGTMNCDKPCTDKDEDGVYACDSNGNPISGCSSICDCVDDPVDDLTNPACEYAHHPDINCEEQDVNGKFLNKGCAKCINPNVQELCDGVDNDCDGEIDEGIDFQNDTLNCGGCGIVCMVGYICQAAICALPPPPTTDIEARSIEVSYIDSNGRKVIVGDNDLLMEGINYTLRSTAYARNYPKEGDILNKPTFARFLINGKEVTLKSTLIGDGKVIGGVIPDIPYILIRQLELTADIVLKKEYVNLDPNSNLGNVTIGVAWNQQDYKPVEETASDPFKNNNISKNYKGKVIAPDLAVLRIDVLNQSKNIINAYAIEKSSDTLLINMTYGNIGLKNITEKFKVDLYVNTKTGKKKLDSVNIRGIPSQTNGSFVIKWKAFSDKNNCPYGECNFTGEVSVFDDETNKINNNLVKQFDVIAVKIKEIDKGLKLYEEVTKETVFRRDQEYKIKVRFWGRKSPELNVSKLNYDEDPNIKITASPVTYLTEPWSKEITYNIINPSKPESPAGLYTAYAYSSFKDNNGNTVSAVAELGKNYSIIYDSAISKVDGSYEAYLYGENPALLIKVDDKNRDVAINGYRHMYIFGTQIYFFQEILKQSNISFYIEKMIDINPQDKHTFELAIAAIDGTKSIKEALDKIGTGIMNTFIWNETSKEETPMKALKDVKVEEFVNASNGIERQPRKRATCYVYSIVAASLLRSIGIPSTAVTAPHVELKGEGHAWVEVYNPGQIAGNDWFAYEPQGPDFVERENYFNVFGTPIDRFAEITKGEPGWIKEQKLGWDVVKVNGKWVYNNFRGYIAIQNYTSGVVTKSTEPSASDISLIKNLYQVKK